MSRGHNYNDYDGVLAKEAMIKFLEENKWFPLVHPTNTEYEASKLLNIILDLTIDGITSEVLCKRSDILEFLGNRRMFPNKETSEEEIEIAITLNNILSRIMWEIKHEYE